MEWQWSWGIHHRQGDIRSKTQSKPVSRVSVSLLSWQLHGVSLNSLLVLSCYGNRKQLLGWSFCFCPIWGPCTLAVCSWGHQALPSDAAGTFYGHLLPGSDLLRPERMPLQVLWTTAQPFHLLNYMSKLASLGNLPPNLSKFMNPTTTHIKHTVPLLTHQGDGQ